MEQKISSQAEPLAIRNLTKQYGKFRGVDDLSFAVNRGEIFGFLGPNGAGKSTTIRTIMNFQSPTRGSISIFGLDSVRDSVAAKARIGYLAGELAVYEDLTGRQFLQYLGSFNKKFDYKVVDDLAHRFQAELDRKLRDLSKGNRQKIGLIQAFMHEPDLLILDEPTSGLDPLMQEEFFKLIESVKARGASVFFSSHNLSEIQRVADRAAFIRDGRLVALEDVRVLRDMDVHRLKVTFAGATPSLESLQQIDNVAEAQLAGNTCFVVIRGSVDALIKKIAGYEVTSIDREETNLEDVFLRYYEAKTDEVKS